MYILQLSDFWLSIVESFEAFAQNIGDWNWDNILEYFQNISLGGVALAILTITIKVVVPLLKNSNKKTLQKLGELHSNIARLSKENQTLSVILTEWISLQSEVNEVSKTLKPEHKAAFKELAERMRELKKEKLTEHANMIDDIIADDKVDLSEIQDLIESTEIGKKALGTNINDIVPKGE